MMAQQAAERRQKGCQSVDREHPDRGDAGELEIPPAEGLEGGEGNFQKPAEEAAVNIVVDQFTHR